jgi:hypothetical protein
MPGTNFSSRSSSPPSTPRPRRLETDVRSIDFLYDLQGGDSDADGLRVMPHIRFLNAQDRQHLQTWQFKRRTTEVKPIGTENKTVTHYHLAPQDWGICRAGIKSSATTKSPPR